MDDKKKDIIPSSDDFLMEEPPLEQETLPETPELILQTPAPIPEAPESVPEIPELVLSVPESVPEIPELVLSVPESVPETPELVLSAPELIPEAPAEPVVLLSEATEEEKAPEFPVSGDPVPPFSEDLKLIDEFPDLTEVETEEISLTEEAIPPAYAQWLVRETDPEESGHSSQEAAYPRWSPAMDADATEAAQEQSTADRNIRQRPLRKGRPKRKKGYGFFGIPHLLATAVWLAIILMIGTSLGRMIWVCAADVLAFGRESKQVSVTITSNDTIDDIAEKLHDAELIRYPEVFKLYAKLAVDEGDILPGTFQLDTIYDYHALVVQMGPRSSTRSVVEDVLIPEGLNCRQIFELLEQHNVCTVAELEEYAANGEFADFWFLEGVERGDKYCLEGYLFPDTYDFYEHSTPREALGKMLLGFEARFTEDLLNQLPQLNERLSNMMRANGCSDEFIAANQLTLRDLLTVASLIEEETASSKESPIIASVIFNRLTQDQLYERYLNIDAAIIYATGDANNIDTSLDHPYNTYKYPGLTPGPISNPGLDSIRAALNFEDTQYYYYVLNPETQMHQFSKTLEEHEKWVEEFKNYNGGEG